MDASNKGISADSSSKDTAIKAPEAISKAVACLPPEQMFELMTQMKLCIQNNPLEAKTMLMKNPQLAYALLQAQVVMKIVDPKDLLKCCVKPAQILQTVQPPQIVPPVEPLPSIVQGIPQPVPPPSIIAPSVQDVDLRSTDPRMHRMNDQDLRPVPPPIAPVSFPSDPRQRQFDPRTQELSRPVDPRIAKGMARSILPPSVSGFGVQTPRPVSGLNPNLFTSTSDQDKTALIMQVLQLSDEQIALLPADQRASIVILKAQLAKSSQR